MARKLTRFKVNRQFRKNPTRSRVFFPRKLPFQRDFRLIDQASDMEVGLDFAAKWNKVIEELGQKADKGKLLPRGVKRKYVAAASAAASAAATNTAIAKTLRSTAKKMRQTQSLVTREVLPESIESIAWFLSPLI